MQRRLHFGTAALLAALLATTLASASSAQEIDGRKLVAARQKIRAELVEALSDGNLTRMKQYQILLHAKECLPPEDVQGLQRTLDRLAANNANTTGKPAGSIAQALGPFGTPANGAAAKVDSTNRATLAAYAVPTDSTLKYDEPIATSRLDASAGTLTADAISSGTASAGAISGGTLAGETISGGTVSGGAVPGAMMPAGMIPGNPFVDEASSAEAPDATATSHCEDDVIFADIGAGLLGGPGSLKDNMSSVWEQTWSHTSFFSAVEAFKGPADLGVLSSGQGMLTGNFGMGFGMNAGIPLAAQYGIGVQAGISTTLTDFQGTFSADDVNTPTDECRSQTFTTIGLFQRLPMHGTIVSWGFTHDWLDDQYYTDLHFAQWRVKLGVEWNPCNEMGLWAAMPDHGATTTLTAGEAFADIHFRPLAQGNLYWRHTWCNAATTTTWVGIAQEPGDFVFGADARFPLTQRLALVSDFTYIMPRDNGVVGQTEEMWNVSFGLEFVPGGARHGGAPYRFAPLMPVADNGTMAIRTL